MRGATKGSLQLQQILPLPRIMNPMIDPHRIWNVIYNARSNRHHPPTSPNTAPATQNESHDWSISHMKRHLQCAEQQSTPSNLTKYRTCHAKWISWLIHITYETSFTMRGATGSTLQPHRILRLPRKMNVMIEPHYRWNVIYNARSNRHHPATSPNTAPATQNESHDWSTSHMKRHLQCAEQQSTPSNLTKYRTCHAKWISWLIHITYETSFTMREATGNTLQPHQILRLPRKMNVMIEPHHRWNVIYNARSNRQHPPTSPNTAPATQNDHPTSDRNLLKTGETSFPMRDRSETVPRMIREWSEHDPTQKTQTTTRRVAKATFRTRQEQILLKITTFPAPAIIPNFTTCCTCHEKWHMSFTKCCACHKKWHMNFTKCCACHKKWHMNFTKCCTCHKKWHMNITKCCACHKKWHMNFTKCCTCHKKWHNEHHQMLHLPQKVTHEPHRLLLLLLLLLLGLLGLLLQD